MRYSLRLCLGLALATSAASAADPPAKDARSLTDDRLLLWQSFVDEAALRFGMPRSWIGRVILAESSALTVQNGRPTTSEDGAMGLMQLMPATYEEMRRLHHLGPDPYDPHDNILAGTAYLRDMFDRFGYPGLFAAYNAGPTRFQASLTGHPLPAETRDYLVKVTGTRPMPPEIAPLFVSDSDAKLTSASPIFVVRTPVQSPAETIGDPEMPPETSTPQ